MTEISVAELWEKVDDLNQYSQELGDRADSLNAENVILIEENGKLRFEAHQLRLELARQNVYYTVSEVVDALHVRGYIPAPDYIAEYAFCLLEEDAKFVKQHDFHGVVFTWAGMEHMIAMYVRRP